MPAFISVWKIRIMMTIWGILFLLRKFYQKIREGAMPVTSQVNPGQYEAMFEPILKEGRDIIHLTLSSGISGTYNSALIARDELLERYPDRRIRVIDSLGASCGYGLLVDAAWQKRQEDNLCEINTADFSPII